MKYVTGMTRIKWFTFSGLFFFLWNTKEFEDLVGERKAVKIVPTYFITKDTKLCNRFFSLHFKCTLCTFSTFSFPFLLLFYLFCMICNQTTFLPHVFFLSRTHSIFCQVCEWLWEDLLPKGIKRQGVVCKKWRWRERPCAQVSHKRRHLFCVNAVKISYAVKSFYYITDFNVSKKIAAIEFWL